MGAPAQPNAPTQVYYDPEKQQYFSYKPAENRNPIGDWMTGLGVPVIINGQPYSQTERMYLSNPYTQPTKYTSNYVAPPNATVSDLFPALNFGLAQNLINSQQPTGAMYGAGKYLTGTNLLSMPTTTSESKGK
jgi:hypothetical protein